MEPTDVVRAAYDAFSRGDLPAVLAMCAPDVDWRYCGPSAAPYTGVYRGRDGVTRFFETLVANLSLTSFEPAEFLAAGPTVVVLGREAGASIGPGRGAAYDWVHVFVVGERGIESFREFPDAAAVESMFPAR
jgi:ketosteroid isomerase-like protein